MPSRRLVLKATAAIATLGTGAWGLATAARGNAYYNGPVSDHFNGTRFFNPGGGGEPKGALDLLHWTFIERWEPWPESLPSPLPSDRPPATAAGDSVRIAYVGHASFLIQARGLSILIDPVWAARASPFRSIGPKRVNPPGIAFEHLPRVDCVLLTHNHYDHMDVGIVARLWQRFAPRIVVPLGNDAILRAAVPGLAAEAVDWGARVDLGAGVVVHVEPSLHWSARGAFDRSHALWASYVLQAGAQKIYCVGDTGFGDGATFKGTRQRHPELALALLPIGAYEPRWFMGGVHCNPEDAVSAYQDLVRDGNGGRPCLFAGGHWGTFKLTDEPMDEPPARTRQAWQAAGIADELLWIPSHGETRTVAERSPAHR